MSGHQPGAEPKFLPKAYARALDHRKPSGVRPRKRGTYGIVAVNNSATSAYRRSRTAQTLDSSLAANFRAGTVDVLDIFLLSNLVAASEGVRRRSPVGYWNHRIVRLSHANLHAEE